MSLSRASNPSTVKNVTEMFSIVLCKYGHLHHKELQKLAISICDEAMHMFSTCSWSQAIKFFRRFSLFFIVSVDNVCAAKCDDPYSVSLSGGDGRIAAFVHIFLENFHSMPYVSFMNFFTSFCFTSKQMISKLNARFFVDNEHFKLYDDGTVESMLTYRSSKDYVEKNIDIKDEEQACEFFNMTLGVSGGMDYDDLIYNLTTALPKIGSFFFELSSIEKFCYFRNRQKLFYICSNGYVMLAEQALQEVIKFFRSLLQRNNKMYYLKLVKALRNSNLHVCEYFDINTFSEVIEFFYSNPRTFLVESDFYVSAVTIHQSTSDENKPARDLITLETPGLPEGKLPTLSKQDGSNKRENCDEIIPSEDQVILFLLSHLGKQNIHYRKLLSSCFRKSPYILKFFEGCSSSQEFHFFKRHSNYFHFGSNGYVSAVRNKNSFRAQNKESKAFFPDVTCRKPVVEYPFNFFKDTSEFQKKMKASFFQIRLIDRLVEILEKNNQRKSTASRLMNTAKSSGEYYEFFLYNMSLQDFCDVLRARPDVFTVGNKGIVHLTDQLGEEPEKTQQTSAEVCLQKTEMDETSCRQSHSDSESSCITTWEDLDISEDFIRKKNKDLASETQYKNNQSSTVVKLSIDTFIEDKDYLNTNSPKSAKITPKTQHDLVVDRNISNSTVTDHTNNTTITQPYESFMDDKTSCKTMCQKLNISEERDFIQKNVDFESETPGENDQRSAVIKLSAGTFAKSKDSITTNNCISVKTNSKTEHLPVSEKKILNSSIPDQSNDITIAQCYQSFTENKTRETVCQELNISEAYMFIQKNTDLGSETQYKNDLCSTVIKLPTDAFAENANHIAPNDSAKTSPKTEHEHMLEKETSNSSVPDHINDRTECYQSFTNSNNLCQTTRESPNLSEEQDSACKKDETHNKNVRLESHQTVTTLKSRTDSCTENEDNVTSDSRCRKIYTSVQDQPICERKQSISSILDCADENYYSSDESSCGFEMQELPELKVSEQPEMSAHAACSSSRDVEKQDVRSETVLKHENMTGLKNVPIDKSKVSKKSGYVRRPNLIHERISGSQNIGQDQYMKCLIDAVNLAYEETRSAKKVLQSFLDLNRLALGSSNSESFLEEYVSNNEYNIWKFQSRVEQKCVEFFRRVLRNAGMPITVSDLKVLLLAATDDVRNHMSSHYQSANLVSFFLKHSDSFYVDEMHNVYLKLL